MVLAAIEFSDVGHKTGAHDEILDMAGRVPVIEIVESEGVALERCKVSLRSSHVDPASLRSFLPAHEGCTACCRHHRFRT